MVDRYAVSVVIQESDEVVEHLPRKISHVCSLFLRRGGEITCEITGRRRHSLDLPQGGLEIPCILVFTTQEEKELTKLKKVTNNR